MPEISIDMSDDDAMPDLGIAPDGPGITYTLTLPSCSLVISHEQLESLYRQIRPWFAEE